MAKTHAPYPPAFRAEAIELARTSGKGVPQLAQDLGVSEQALRGWIKRADIDAGRGRPGELTTAEREELRQLRRENQILRQEREILKNAPARGAPRRMKMGRWLYWTCRPGREAVAFRCRQSP